MAFEDALGHALLASFEAVRLASVEAVPEVCDGLILRWGL